MQVQWYACWRNFKHSRSGLTEGWIDNAIQWRHQCRKDPAHIAGHGRSNIRFNTFESVLSHHLTTLQTWHSFKIIAKRTAPGLLRSGVGGWTNFVAPLQKMSHIYCPWALQPGMGKGRGSRISSIMTLNAYRSLNIPR